MSVEINIPDAVSRLRSSIVVRLAHRYGTMKALDYMNQLQPPTIGYMTKLQLTEDLYNAD
jgi:hypothetical protein